MLTRRKNFIYIIVAALKNSMPIKVNKLKLIWNNVKERKSYNNVVKQIPG